MAIATDMPWPGIKPGTPRWASTLAKSYSNSLLIAVRNINSSLARHNLFFLSGHTGLAGKFSQELATLTCSQNRAFASIWSHVLLQGVLIIDWYEHCHLYSWIVSDTDCETVPFIFSDTDCETVPLIVSDNDCETVPLIVSDTDCETVPLIVSDTDCETVPLIVSDTDCETVPLSAGGAGDDLLPGRVAVPAARLENGQDSRARPEGQAGSAGQSTQWVSSSRVRVSEFGCRQIY